MIKKAFSNVTLAASIAVIVTFFFLPAAAQVRGRVVAVADGDTITVLDTSERQHKVRLAGIDAPEKAQDFGNRAKQNLSSLVYGKTVTFTGAKIDRYGRRVAKVIVNGVDANLEQIKAGYAWHYKKYQNEQSTADRRIYASAEIVARRANLNIWSSPNPTPPWDFRAGGSPASIVGRSEATLPAESSGKIIGNRNSGIYHWPGCPSYSKVALQNRVLFETRHQAENEGYVAAKNCNGENLRGGSSVKSEPAPRPVYTAPRSTGGYIRGPRGGCYYINSNGNKTYVDRSLCQ